MKITRFLAAAALAAVAFAAPATAAPTRALVLGDVSFMEDLTPILTDLTGRDARFDHAASGVWNLRDGLPEADVLAKYDSVLAFTDSVSVDLTALSDLLGHYVEHGGGVVIGTFWGQEGGTSGGLLNSHGFNPLVDPVGDAYASNELGAFDAADPLLKGVHSLTANYYDADYAGVDAGATLAASWSNGRPLAAYNAAHSVAAITLYPNVVTFGHAGGDYRPLFANALALTAGNSGTTGAVPEPASWALMLGGFGLVGSALRRRSTTPVVALA